MPSAHGNHDGKKDHYEAALFQAIMRNVDSPPHTWMLLPEIFQRINSILPVDFETVHTKESPDEKIDLEGTLMQKA